MRILLILFMLCLIEGKANASWWYILDKDEKVVAKQNGEPKVDKLEMDRMFSVKSELDIDVLKAEYKNKKIVDVALCIVYKLLQENKSPLNKISRSTT